MEPQKHDSNSSLFRAVRDALSGVQHDYTEGKLGRAITLLAIPMVLEMAMESLFAICDIYFVSHLGSHAVATVGLTESMMTIFYAIAIGLAMATTATVARRVGEDNILGATSAGAQAVYLGLALAAIIGVPCWLFAPSLLEFMGAEQEVLDIGGNYASILLGFNVVILMLFLNNAIFRGAGDAVVAMRSLWLANGINIVLDPILIFGLGPIPAMGLTGAAIATTCGRGVGVLYQFWALRNGASRIVFRGNSMRLDLAAMWRLLVVSLGGIGQFLIATSSWIVLMRIMSRFGSEALAGYTIAIRIIIFTLLPAWGLGNAAATLVGQSLGAGKPDRAEAAVYLAGWFNMAFFALVMLVFWTLGPSLIGMFSENPEELRIGAMSLQIISYGYIFYAWAFVLTQAFNGAGDTKTPTWINFGCFWMLQIPLAYLMTEKLELGPASVFWAVAIAESAMAGVALYAFRRGKWKLTRI